MYVIIVFIFFIQVIIGFSSSLYSINVCFIFSLLCQY